MIRFGPSGNSDEFYKQGYKHTYEAMKWIYGMGLNAFEYSFGRGVKMKHDTAKKIREEAENYGIALSVHAPYYINLATAEAEGKKKNIEYVLSTARAAKNLGATRMVVHPGSASKADRLTVFQNIKEAVSEILGILDKEGFYDIAFCPETMGRLSQMGSLDEIIELCSVNERLIPAIDFGHIYARTLGGIKTKGDFKAILDAIENTLGFERLNTMHCHISKIEYTNIGEKKHLVFDQIDFGPDYTPLMELFAERELNPVIICESQGTMAKDALFLKTTYENHKEVK